MLTIWIVLTTCGLARARSSSAPFFGCDGCHNDGQGDATLELLAAELLEPGVPVELTVLVRSPNMARAGLFASTYGVGVLEPSPATQLVGSDITHRGSASANGGQASFQFVWTPPDEPGGANLHIFAIAANGDSRNSGDQYTESQFSFAWGCSDPSTIYIDRDVDGFGNADVPASLTCAPRLGWSEAAGDCRDSNANIYPGAPELCNDRDDDCDGEIDEEVALIEYFIDVDGDGHGDPQYESVIDCVQPEGYAPNKLDCDDANPTRYLYAEEVCDFIDNDCDDRVDEGARARCGVGWCERLAQSCGPTQCVPGPPAQEVCNGFDDDCDGVVDNDVTCPDDQACFEHRCIQAEDAALLAESQTDLPTSTQPSNDQNPTSDPESARGEGPGASASAPPTTGSAAASEQTRPEASSSGEAASEPDAPKGSNMPGEFSAVNEHAPDPIANLGEDPRSTTGHGCSLITLRPIAPCRWPLLACTIGFAICVRRRESPLSTRNDVDPTARDGRNRAPPLDDASVHGADCVTRLVH